MEDLLELCQDTSDFLFRNPSELPIPYRLKRDPLLREWAALIEERLHTVAEVFSPKNESSSSGQNFLKAVAWNIERGKHLEAVIYALKNHPEISGADFYFLTEVDWGMVRTENRNVTAQLGEALGLYAYFAPSYYNFTKGHGSERHLPGKNELGLHGKAILSRLPLEDLRVVSLPNATDKLRSKESRLGQKRALLGNFNWKGKLLQVACAHLDAFSSPRSRARQLCPALQAFSKSDPVLIAGDWNTNTMDSTSPSTLLKSILRQILHPGPQKMIRFHHPYPQRKFDRPLFEFLKSFGFDFEGCNEMGVGTFDLFSNDQELGQMASDQFPLWLLNWINRRVQKAGGIISLKLDWFAARRLRTLHKKVIRLRPEKDFSAHDRPSDHHPILLQFEI